MNNTVLKAAAWVALVLSVALFVAFGVAVLLGADPALVGVLVFSAVVAFAASIGLQE
jgi:hypothetical protein